MAEDIAEIVDSADLDEDQQAKLEREFAREYHLITREDRLEKIAEDIVAHYTGRGLRFCGIYREAPSVLERDYGCESC